VALEAFLIVQVERTNLRWSAVGAWAFDDMEATFGNRRLHAQDTQETFNPIMFAHDISTESAWEACENENSFKVPATVEKQSTCA